MEKSKEYVTPLDVAKKLNVEDKYLSLNAEKDLDDYFFEQELKKTLIDFLNSDEVIL